MPPPSVTVAATKNNNGGSGSKAGRSSLGNGFGQPSPLRDGFDDDNNNRDRGVDDDDDDDDDDDEGYDDADDEEEDVAVNARWKGKRRNRRAIDDDNKSHMSELTEDRTQKHFDAAMLVYSANPQLRAAIQGSPRNTGQAAGPPAIIGIAEESSNDQMSSDPTAHKLGTIMSQSGRPPKAYASNESPTRRSGSGGARDVDRILNETGSVSSSRSKMSVAQRARLEADRKTTPVRIRMNKTPLRRNHSYGKNEESPNNRSMSDSGSRNGKGFLRNIGRRLEEAIDNSVLGVDTDTEGSDEYATTDVQSDTEYEDEKKTETASEASTTVSMSLAQRQALQRAQQVKFLKDQGLINKEEDVRGGAGSDSRSVVSNTPPKPLSRREKLAKASRGKEPARLASV
ncbi:MAG: hypothetical protein SGARI_001721 [Bacillariaceae sp.]